MTCSADFEKVSLVLNGTMHLMYRRSNNTLCGLEWHYHNSHGEAYCRKCQRALAKAMKPSKEGG
jgi:hypothetical protein